MIMAVAKSDCLSIDTVVQDLNIGRTTLYSYMRHLGISSHRFPFDRKSYILKSDVERIRQFLEEIRGQ